MKCMNCDRERNVRRSAHTTEYHCLHCGDMLVFANTELPEFNYPSGLAVPVTATDPAHYRSHPSGVECIEITKHMNFCLGNAIKYIWRAGLKGEALEDLKKAAWYINCEIERLEKDK